MNLRQLAGGFVLAAVGGFGLAVVSPAGASVNDQKKKEPQPSHVKAPKPSDRDAEIRRLDHIISEQEKILRRLQRIQDSGLPGIANLTHELLDTVRANQAQLIQVIGGLQLQCSFADLAPIGLPGYLPTDGSRFCRLDPNTFNLLVQVNNAGGVDAGVFRTHVSFFNGGVSDVDTIAPLPAFNGSITLDAGPIPANCYQGDPSYRACNFVITVDSATAVAESNEVNNTAVGFCAIIG
jgi:hypothetical protein